MYDKRIYMYYREFAAYVGTTCNRKALMELTSSVVTVFFYCKGWKAWWCPERLVVPCDSEENGNHVWLSFKLTCLHDMQDIWEGFHHGIVETYNVPLSGLHGKRVWECLFIWCVYSMSKFLCLITLVSWIVIICCARSVCFWHCSLMQ